MKNSQVGFTLIELMVVIAIIGILAAIAIPQFSAYRTRSYKAALESDAHSIASAQEAYFVKNGLYASRAASLLSSDYGAGNLSADTTILLWHADGAKAFSFRIGNTAHVVTTIVYDSARGGLQ